MEKQKMERAIKNYNKLMLDTCCDHCMIGHGELTKNWNLRDMVSEMQYMLDSYNNPNNAPYQDAHMEDQPIVNGRKEYLYEWQKIKARMSRFITTYAPHVKDMKCCEGHFSKWDNE